MTSWRSCWRTRDFLCWNACPMNCFCDNLGARDLKNWLEPMEGSAGWSLKFEIRRKCLQARKLDICWNVGVRPRDLIHLLNTDLLLLPQMPVQFHGSFSEVAAWSSFRKPFHTFSSTKQWERRADSVFPECVAENYRLWVGIWGLRIHWYAMWTSRLLDSHHDFMFTGRLLLKDAFEVWRERIPLLVGPIILEFHQCWHCLKPILKHLFAIVVNGRPSWLNSWYQK